MTTPTPNTVSVTALVACPVCEEGVVCGVTLSTAEPRGVVDTAPIHAHVRATHPGPRAAPAVEARETKPARLSVVK